MKFGIQLPVQAQSRLMAQQWEFTAGPDEIARVATACDRHGFDYVGVCDHIGVPRSTVDRMGTTWYDTVATMGWLAALTQRVRLLSHVFVVVYRHPLVTAKAFATLDALSGGRAILGVGVGHVKEEFDVLGVPFESRGAMADEYLPAIKQAFADEWGSGELGQAPRPVQPGGPPIWVGGSSAPALRRAGTLADGWLPQGPPPGGMAAAVATLTEHRARVGRDMTDFAVSGGLSCFVGTPDFDVPEWVVTGSVDRLVDAVGQQAQIGITHVQVRLHAQSCQQLEDQIAAFESVIAQA